MLSLSVYIDICPFECVNVVDSGYASFYFNKLTFLKFTCFELNNQT